MKKINQIVSWYQLKIAGYDKQLWEDSVEKRVLKSIHNIPKKAANLKSELIDVDLVRGSTFTKTKPQQAWPAVIRWGLLRMLFLPLYIKWWHQQTSSCFVALLLFLYVMQIASLCTCIRYGEGLLSVQTVEVMVPLIMMTTVALIHSQIVATHRSHKPRSTELKNLAKKTKRKSSLKSSRKKSNGTKQKQSKVPNNLRQSIKRPESLSRSESHSSSYSNIINISKPGSPCSQAKDNRPHAVIKNILENTDPCLNTCSSTTITANISHHDTDDDNDSTPSSSNFEMLTDDRALCESMVYTSLDENDQTAAKPGENYSVLLKPITDVTGELLSPDAILLPEVSEEKKVNSIYVDDDSTRPDGLDVLDRHSDTEECITDNADYLPNNIDGPDTDYHADVDNVTESRKGCVGFTMKKRRRSVNGADKARLRPQTSSGSRRFPNILRLKERNNSAGISSCDSEVESVPSPLPSPLIKMWDTTTPPSNQDGQTSEVDWDNNMGSDIAMSDSSSSSTDSADEKDECYIGSETEDPFCHHVPQSVMISSSPKDNTTCLIWEGNECKKVELSTIDIGWFIIDKVDNIPENTDYVVLGLVLSILLSVMPVIYRLYHVDKIPEVNCWNDVLGLLKKLCSQDWRVYLIMLNGFIQRLSICSVFFFLLSVAERTFQQRFQYAKHFCHLTSTRRARKYDLPHFRLNKVCNIKTWLSLRSYLKKRGPQRSVNVIVSATFLLGILLVSLMCFELLKNESNHFVDHLYNWELVVWVLGMGIFMLRFTTLGSKINKKYRSISILITEQVNLYLHMEQKPHKKEELMLANNVLKLAEELIKELESPFKISGLSANPFLSNVTKVVLLSAISAVLTELLGFQLRVWKLKLKV